MRPINLKMKNFKSHKDSEIEFEDGVLYYLIGVVDGNRRRSNNAGKSSIIHAINFALWRQIEESSDVKLEELIRTGEKHTLVEYEFEVMSGLVRVEREIKQTSKSASSILRVFIDKDGEWQEHESREMSDRQAFLENLLGFSKYTWFKASMRTQGMNPEFFSVTPERRVEMLSKIMGHQDIIDKALSIIKAKIKIESEIKVELEVEKRTLDRSVLDQGEIVEISDEIIETKNEIERLRELIADIQIRVGIEKEIEEIESEIESCKYEYGAEMERAMQGLTDEKNALIKEKKNVKEEREHRLKEINDKMDMLGTNLSRIERETSRYKKACEIEVLEPNGDEEKIEGDIDSLVEDKEKSQKLSSNVYSKLAVLDSELDSLESAGDSLCPILGGSCERVSKDAIGNIVCDKEKELKDLEKNKVKHDDEILDISDRITELRKQLKDIETQRREREGYLAAKHEYDEFIKRHAGELDSIEEDMKSYEGEKESFETPSKREYVIEDEISELNDSVDSFEITESAKKWDNKIVALTKKEDGLKKRVADLFTENISDVKKLLKEEESHLISLSASIETHEKSLSESEEVKKKLTPVLDACEELSKMKYTFGKQGFLSAHMSSILPELEKKVNDYLGFFDSGRLSVSMAEPITIYDAVTETNFRSSSLSFGQRSVIAFCYGMALVWVRFKSSPSMRMICMDEPFEHVDEEYLESSLSVILHLYKELGLSSCMLISHKHFANEPDNMRTIEIKNNDGICQLSKI